MSRFTDPSYFKEHPFLEYGFIVSACMAQLVTLQATVDALPHMDQLRQDFNAPESLTPWYIAAFGLSIGTLILVSGRVGDAYGIKQTLIGGYIWTVIWSILSGISWYDRGAGASMYICCRAFQGAGIAFVLPNALGAVGRVYAPGTLRKNIVFGLIGFCAPLGGFSGAFMSGVIAVRTKYWYWNYYAYAIFAAIGCVLSIICVPDIAPKLTLEGKRQDLDLVGSLLGVSALVLFNFAWNQAPVVGWQSPYIITLLVVSFPLFALFVFWEIKMASHPLLPKILLTNRRLMATLFIIFLGWGSFGINLYHHFTLILNFRHYTPFEAGATTSPAPVTGLIAAISCSILISPKTVELILFISMLCFLSLSLIICTAEVHQSYWRNTFGAWIIGPFGMDWSFPAGTILLSEELPPEFQGLAGSLVTVMVNYGISIFLGVAGTVEQELLNQRPDDSWRAWRGATYFGVGISGLASIVAFYFVATKASREAREKQLQTQSLEVATKSTRESEKFVGQARCNSHVSSQRDSVSELSV